MYLATTTADETRETEERDGAWCWNWSNSDASSCGRLKGDEIESANTHRCADCELSPAVVGQVVCTKEAEAEVVG